MRKNLVILRAGDESLHGDWVAGPRRDFDLFISYFGATRDRHRADAEYYEMRRGPKWSCLADLLTEHDELVQQYDAVWFPDDDLAVDTSTINRMFALFHGFALALAQPALTAASYITYRSTVQVPGAVLRYVGFVEIMAPIFDQAALAACRGTFSENRSGWGLDWVWPQRVRALRDGADRERAIAILDVTPVTHTRPLGGELYQNNPEMNPHQEAAATIEQHAVQWERYRLKYENGGAVRYQSVRWWERVALQLRTWAARRRYRRKYRAADASDEPTLAAARP